jgi:hypothetical protein
MIVNRERRMQAERVPWEDSVALRFVEVDRAAGRAWNAEITMVEQPDGLITLLASQAQELMDDLWRCGLRPTEGRGSAGALAATQNHLADMRAIAMHTP